VDLEPGGRRSHDHLRQRAITPTGGSAALDRERLREVREGRDVRLPLQVPQWNEWDRGGGALTPGQGTTSLVVPTLKSGPGEPLRLRRSAVSGPRFSVGTSGIWS